jgi:tetratricopeptide (TPR) repeat protein
MNLQDRYRQAIDFYQRGNLEEAERLCRQMLSVNPSGFAPRYMLGVICAQQGRNVEALEFIGDALKAQPNDVMALLSHGNILNTLGRFEEAVGSYNRALVIKQDHIEALFSRGIALTELKRFAEALESFDRVLAIQPAFAEALGNRGNALRGLHRFDEALASYDQALAIKADFAEALSNRGAALCDLKRFADALLSYDKALAIKPNDIGARYNRGHALQDLEQYEEAVASYDDVLAIMPDVFDALYNRGVALSELKRFDDALLSYDKALVIKPDDAETLYNRGLALCDLNRSGEALASYDRALAVKPLFIEALGNRGIPLQQLKRFEEAIASFDHAIVVDPGDAKNYWNKGLCKLLMGHFGEGWRLYELRKKLQQGEGHCYTQPLWSGEEDISGKVLHIYAEQGLGDTIQFCRYAVLAQARGAKVVLSVRKEIRRLIETVGLPIEILASEAVPFEFDYHIPLLSMPLAFKTDQSNVPANVPYLHAEPERTKAWGDKIGSDGLKIGISWQGKKHVKADIGRSFPLRTFENISKIRNVRLISLQKNAGVEQLQNLPQGMKVETLGDQFDDGPDAFIDTAAVMKHLDLIITPDTSIAHLAGALGRPTWVVLKYVPDWRWLLDRLDSPWYPTARLFRQQVDGDWAEPFAQMEHQLLNAAS